MFKLLTEANICIVLKQHNHLHYISAVQNCDNKIYIRNCWKTNQERDTVSHKRWSSNVACGVCEGSWVRVAMVQVVMHTVMQLSAGFGPFYL